MDKIISLEERLKKSVVDEFINIVEELKEEGIVVDIDSSQFKMIVDEFYDYYKRKSILYSFVETMKAHLGDMMIDCSNENCSFDVEFVLEELKLYELLDSLLAVNPKDTKRIVDKLYQKVGDNNERRKHH
ncbi:MAG: hypothetical protein IKE70_03090 [Bacilli bacterium]|nr:hypothetical protein [Bacilli bacterium]